MRFVSFLLLLCLPLAAFAEHRYVVIRLNNDKQVRAEWLAEDDSTIQVRDDSGTRLSIRKELVASIEVIDPDPPGSRDVAVEPAQKSLAQFAAEVKAARTGKSRAFTVDDLSGAPQLSFLSKGPDPEPESTEPAPAVDVSSWRKRIDSVEKELDALHGKEESAASRCEQARNALFTKPKMRDGIAIVDPLAIPEECKELAALQQKHLDAESRLDDLQTQARHQGIPWSALE